jgi:phosphate transport system substrate-binding protein
MTDPLEPQPPPASPPRSSPARPVVRRRSDRLPVYLALTVVLAAAAVVGAGLGTGWYGLAPKHASTDCPSGVQLEGAGASFPEPIEAQWASGFSGQTGDTVNYQASGAGEGITSLTEKQVDFALTDEPLNASEASSLTAAVGSVLTLPVVGGAVSLVYNLPSYHGPLNLTADQIAGLFNGTITSWDAAALTTNNPGLASVSTSVYVVERSDPAGMSYVLTNLLSDLVPWWASQVGTSVLPAWPAFAHALPESGNSGLLKELTSQTGAIGYTDLYDAESRSLPSALVEDPMGAYVAPSPESAGVAVNATYAKDPTGFPASNGSWSGVSFVDANATGAYPLATLAYAMVPQDPAAGYTSSLGDAEILVAWLHWVLTSGQSFNETAFPYVDPPAGLVTEALGALSTMNYNNRAIPGCG